MLLTLSDGGGTDCSDRGGAVWSILISAVHGVLGVLGILVRSAGSLAVVLLRVGPARVSHELVAVGATTWLGRW